MDSKSGNYLDDLTALGNSEAKTPTELLESFPCPELVWSVIMTADEVTAVCPKTGQPDQYVVEIDYVPESLCIESKSLKLYLQSFRNKGIFVEALSTEVLSHVIASVSPVCATVTITQKSRGGISITVGSEYKNK